MGIHDRFARPVHYCIYVCAGDPHSRREFMWRVKVQHPYALNAPGSHATSTKLGLGATHAPMRNLGAIYNVWNTHAEEMDNITGYMEPFDLLEDMHYWIGVPNPKDEKGWRDLARQDWQKTMSTEPETFFVANLAAVDPFAHTDPPLADYAKVPCELTCTKYYGEPDGTYTFECQSNDIKVDKPMTKELRKAVDTMCNTMYNNMYESLTSPEGVRQPALMGCFFEKEVDNKHLEQEHYVYFFPDRIVHLRGSFQMVRDEDESVTRRMSWNAFVVPRNSAAAGLVVESFRRSFLQDQENYHEHSWNIFSRKWVEKRREAFAMALHPRIGKDSAAHGMEEGLFAQILDDAAQAKGEAIDHFVESMIESLPQVRATKFAVPRLNIQ